ncbi:hypothetical protein KPG66_10210 [Mycetohabitans sp. B2]|jgi:hypothetical protein|uniref:hypothetical protein n=1 Tax=Mycetohabitans sp. B2 TaxID=2841274 RepID=UPI001F350C60|nr:hypothetical protein [Mycetohabitans sp. B2]MCF7696448.1 hypothetical protein [Mycetohabitans sp. B2]
MATRFPCGNGNYTSSMSVPSELERAALKDVLKAVANGNGPKRFSLTHGQTGRIAMRDSMMIAGTPSIDAEMLYRVMRDPLCATLGDVVRSSATALAEIHSSGA